MRCSLLVLHLQPRIPLILRRGTRRPARCLVAPSGGEVLRVADGAVVPSSILWTIIGVGGIAAYSGHEAHGGGPSEEGLTMPMAAYFVLMEHDDALWC